MLGLLASLWLAATPPTPTPTPTPTPAPIQDTAPETISDTGPAAGSVEGPARAPTSEDPTRPRRSKGEKLLIASGVAYGLGSAIQWTTAGATGLLGDARPGGSSGVTLGMTLGGMGMIPGVLLAGAGGQALARDSSGKDHLARPILAGGAVVTGLGGAAVAGGVMLWPTIRSQCRIGMGCNLAALHVGGAVMSVGVGMIGYGNALRLRDPEYRRLRRKAKTPLTAGSVLLGAGYLMSATAGMVVWQDDPEDALARRTRNRLLIPVVGPWIHAAGPDAPLIVAIFTGGLGAMQIGGAIALIVGAGIARGQRTRERVQVAVAPSFNGVAVFGRF